MSIFDLQRQYEQSLCELDAEWNVFCHCASEQTWANYTATYHRYLRLQQGLKSCGVAICACGAICDEGQRSCGCSQSRLI